MQVFPCVSTSRIINISSMDSKPKSNYLKVPSSCCSRLVKSPKSGVTVLRKPRPSNIYAYKMATPLLPVNSFILQVNLKNCSIVKKAS